MRAMDRSKVIVVRLDEDTELLFRFLTVGDEVFLAALVEEGGPPRDLALRVLNNQLHDTSPTNLEELDDVGLARAAHCWADQDSSVGKQAAEGQRSLEEFRQRIASHIEETRQALVEFSQRMYPHVEQRLEELHRAATAFSPAILRGIDQLVCPPDHVTRAIREAVTIPSEQLAAIGRALSTDAFRAAVLAVEEQGRLIRELAAASRQIEAISRSMTVAVPSSDLVRSLPSAREIVEVWQRHRLAIERGQNALDEEGFSFAKSVVGMDLAVALSGIPKQVRGAHATNRLLAFTKGEPFGLALEDQVRRSDVSRRRWGGSRTRLRCSFFARVCAVCTSFVLAGGGAIH